MSDISYDKETVQELERWVKRKKVDEDELIVIYGTIKKYISTNPKIVNMFLRLWHYDPDLLNEIEAKHK